ncbi:MAG: glycerol transporter [Chrysothrix sp. TS-e1954]|nr:MAG: glycerol transporter [Chrysothrix sp. TS-e1954]
MLLGHRLKAVYSLDTLDTRLTVSSQTPIKAARAEHGTGSSRPAAQGVNAEPDQTVQTKARPSKWRTKEYYFYYLVITVMVPIMFWVPYHVSKESDPQYPKFAPLLSEGWIPGRKVVSVFDALQSYIPVQRFNELEKDNSDQQYASFRNNIPYIGVVVIAHPLLRRLFDTVYQSIYRSPPPSQASHEAQLDAHLSQRISYDTIFGAIFLVVLHGFSALKVLLLLYINFCIATKLPRNAVPAVTWTFSLIVLFGNEELEGYPWPWLGGFLGLQEWGHWLDSFGGLMPRWEVLFNVTVLRLISYNLDFYWSLEDKSPSDVVEKKNLTPSLLSERDRINTPASSQQFALPYYLSYTLYSPLYLAGPIVTFNDYISQSRSPSPSITLSRTINYGFRFLVSLLTMEIILHYIYPVAISKSDPDWSAYTPFQLSMLGYFNLHLIWLKLLLIWRLFRLWALLDGIDPPENMIRCMSNNYSALGFWRNWHRSFNRWIIRYLFIPLGGSGGRGTSTVRGIANMLLVFTFVALWHDITARLLAWSWLVVLFILPEVICSTLLFPARNYKDRPETYRVLCGIGAVGNILMMMAANLVGFAVGLDGLEGLVKGIVGGWFGVLFLGMACATLYVGAQVMFELREAEKRRGIDLKC